MPPRRTRAAKHAAAAAPFAALQARLGYTFRNLDLLHLALKHRSFSYESRGIDPQVTKNQALPGDDNEQLEFLGDAVLGLLVSEAIFRDFPQCGEGELTRLRAALVSRKRMAEVGAHWRLGEELLLGRSAEYTGGRTKPALQANAAEAVIAAIYLDGGLEPVRTLIERDVIAPELPAMRRALEGSQGGALRDYKTLLQERVQATAAGKLRYVHAGESGPPHQRLFRIEAQLIAQPEAPDVEPRTLATAEASTKKEAQQQAAQQALANWPQPEAQPEPAPEPPLPPEAAA